jgi:hypothetical protein
MGPLDTIADRCMGHLGLFLIGAISCTADRLRPGIRPEPGVPTRIVPRRNPTPERAARPGASLPTTQRAGG